MNYNTDSFKKEFNEKYGVKVSGIQSVTNPRSGASDFHLANMMPKNYIYLVEGKWYDFENKPTYQLVGYVFVGDELHEFYDVDGVLCKYERDENGEDRYIKYPNPDVDWKYLLSRKNQVSLVQYTVWDKCKNELKIKRY